jgi:hypothetical protein
MRRRSRRAIRASFANNTRPMNSEGAGNAGRSVRPQPCVRNKKAHKRSHHGHAGTPGIPRAMVLTAYSALSPVTGLVCHRRLRKGSRKLDASVGASGPHDFAVRIRRASSLRTISVHRIPPHVRDDRETPLERRRDRIDIFLFLPRRQAEFRKFRNRPGIAGTATAL